MNKKLLYKYLRNQCTPEELEEVIQWFRETVGTGEGKKILAQWWREMPEKGFYAAESELVDYERILDRIHHNVNIAQSLSLGKRGKLVKISKVFSRVAAVLFLPLFFVSLFFIFNGGRKGGLHNYPLYTEIVSPYGSRIHIDLPDGSKVWLNNGSKLKFPQKFTGRERRVKLTGEAFFEVAHNPHKPFVVGAGSLQVVATGTEFDVMAYPDDYKIEATLIKGKVYIQRALPSGKVHQVYEMKPNQHAIYNEKNKKFYYINNSSDKYISWMDGKLIFRDDPLDVVIKRLERWYNVDIVINNPQLRKFTYTATFVDETLPQVLDLLKIATPINYSLIRRKKLPDGSFSKQKVIISYAARNK